MENQTELEVTCVEHLVELFSGMNEDRFSALKCLISTVVENGEVVYRVVVKRRATGRYVR